MIVHITKCSYTNKKKDGTTIVTKTGKILYRVGLLTSEHGDKWVNGFLPFAPTDWEGSTQELEIEREEYKGDMKLVFNLPSGPSARQGAVPPNDRHMTEIKIALGKMNAKLDILIGERNSDGSKLPSFDIDSQQQEEEAFDNLPEEVLDDPSKM